METVANRPLADLKIGDCGNYKPSAAGDAEEDKAAAKLQARYD